MDKLNRIPALTFALLLFFTFACVAAVLAGSTREFSSPPVTVGVGAIAPHASMDNLNRVHAVYSEWPAGPTMYRVASWPGETFAAARVVDSGDAWNPRVSAANSNVYVAHTYRNGSTYYPRVFRFVDNSWNEIFDGEDVVGPDVGALDYSYADVASSGSNVYVVADTNHDGLGEISWTILFSSSTNNGVSFSAPDGVGASAGARYPAVASSGSNVYVVWVEGGNVHLNSNPDNGDPGPINLSNSGNVHNYRPGLAALGNDAFAAWSGADDIFFASTREPGRVYNITEGIAIHKREPSVGVSLDQNGLPHVRLAWRETSSGKPVIRFQEAFWDDVAGEFVWGIDLNDDGAIAGDEVDRTILVHTGHAGDDHTPELAVAQTGVVYALWRNSQAGVMGARYLGPSPYRQPPTNLTALGGDLQVTLNWEASVSPDVDSYRIYRGVTRGEWGDPIATVDASVLTFTDTTVFNNTIYWYAVRAVFGAGESDYSNQVSVTPGVQVDDVDPPVPPTNLLALPGSGSVSLSWDASVSTDLERYHVYSRTSSADSFVFVGQVPADDTEYEHEGLTNGIAYEYVVTVIDANNNESADSVSAWAIPGTTDYGTGAPPSAEPGPAPPSAPRRPAETVMDPGSGSGCFIATAAFGGQLSGEVRSLYDFRDAFLMQNSAGRAFVSAYYSLSPAVAGLIENNSALKSVIRLHLIAVVSIIQLVS